MPKLIAILFTLITLFTTRSGYQPPPGLPDDQPLSETILLSVNYAGEGYGTRAMCAHAEVYLHKDGTIRVTVPAEFAEADDIAPGQTEVTIATLQMSPENYDRVAAFASPERIASLRVREDWEVCDGTSYTITLYTDTDAGPVPLLTKGGYMPVGDEFWEVYSYIHARLNLYDVRQLVEDWRQEAIANE